MYTLLPNSKISLLRLFWLSYAGKMHFNLTQEYSFQHGSTIPRLHKFVFTDKTWFLFLAQVTKSLQVLGEFFHPMREISQVSFYMWNIIYASINYKIWKLKIGCQEYGMWVNSSKNQIYKEMENEKQKLSAS